MICATCFAATDSAMCERCGYSSRLAQKYSLQRPLPGATETPTFFATTPEGQELVAEKVVQASHVYYQTWEAAARGLKILQRLRHPLFPKIHEVVESGTGDMRAIWMIREHLPAPSLLAEAKDRRFTETEVLDVLTQLLDGLASLHAAGRLSHGRVEPGSLFRRPGGSLVLAGFVAAARDHTHRPEDDGPTQASAFIPPELGEGTHTARSDVYGAGMIAVYLLGGVGATTTRDVRGRLDWKLPPGVRAEVGTFLGALTQRNPHARPADAGAALEHLAKLHPPAVARAAAARPPVKLEEADTAGPALIPADLEQLPPGYDDAGRTPPGMGLQLAVLGLGVVLGVAASVAGTASASLRGGGGPEWVQEQKTGLGERVVASFPLRSCAEHWRELNPDAPEDAPYVLVTILPDGALVPVPADDEANDLTASMDDCARFALGSVHGPPEPLHDGDKHLTQMLVPLGAQDPSRIRWVWEAM